MVGDYAAWSYFQSIDRPENRDFVAAVQGPLRRGPADRATRSWRRTTRVKLWAQAVEESGHGRTAEIRKAIRAREPATPPRGSSRSTPRPCTPGGRSTSGKIRGDGQFEIVWSLEKPIRPVPYPVLRTRADWDAFVEKLNTTGATSGIQPPDADRAPPPAGWPGRSGLERRPARRRHGRRHRSPPPDATRSTQRSGLTVS